MDRIRFGLSSIDLLICSDILQTDFLRFLDLVGRRIPPPQPYDISTHRKELLLVETRWCNSGQLRDSVEKGER